MLKTFRQCLKIIFSFSVESEEHSSELKSPFDCDWVMGMWRSTGRRSSVQGGDSMASGECCERANFDLLHVCEGKIE